MFVRIFNINAIGKLGPRHGKMCYQRFWAASSENVSSNMCKIRTFRSSCTCAKSHPGLCLPLIHSIVFNNSVSGQRRPWSDCADAQADLGLRWPHMPEDMFSHGAAHMRTVNIKINQRRCTIWYNLRFLFSFSYMLDVFKATFIHCFIGISMSTYAQTALFSNGTCFNGGFYHLYFLNLTAPSLQGYSWCRFHNWKEILVSSFGAKFQTKFVLCIFIFNKLSLGKTFICKVERLNVKQRRSWWDGSMSLQKPIIIACGSERETFFGNQWKMRQSNGSSW